MTKGGDLGGGGGEESKGPKIAKEKKGLRRRKNKIQIRQNLVDVSLLPYCRFPLMILTVLVYTSKSYDFKIWSSKPFVPHLKIPVIWLVKSISIM